MTPGAYAQDCRLAGARHRSPVPDRLPRTGEVQTKTWALQVLLSLRAAGANIRIPVEI